MTARLKTTTILDYLQAEGPKSAREIGEVFHISRRSLQQRLKGLVELGFLGVWEESKKEALRSARPPQVYYRTED